MESENTRFAKKCTDLEIKSANFISLYVASYQFQPTLGYADIIQSIHEVVMNFIGAEKFGIYVKGEKPDSLVLAKAEGQHDKITDSISLPENSFFSQIARDGELFLQEQGQNSSDKDRPLAIIPLITSSQLVGMIIIYKLLVQKKQFGAIDTELMEVLRRHAGAALLAARMAATSA